MSHVDQFLLFVVYFCSKPFIGLFFVDILLLAFALGVRYFRQYQGNLNCFVPYMSLFLVFDGFIRSMAGFDYEFWDSGYHDES